VPFLKRFFCCVKTALASLKLASKNGVHWGVTRAEKRIKNIWRKYIE